MRTDWDRYFMDIANLTASRSTCPRKSVGAVLTINNRIISTGYNGSLPGMPHCIDRGCIIIDNHCVATIHAEVNTILSAANAGCSTRGTTLYTTASPCLNCYKMAYQAGITKIVYEHIYGDNPVLILGPAGLTALELVQI